MDDNRLTTIRARLASISKSPWRQCGADRGGCECGQVWSTTEDLPVATAHRGDYPDVPNPSPATAKANAALIAHAPADLTYLCDEVERLTCLIGSIIQEATPRWSRAVA